MKIAALLPHVEIFGGVRRYIEIGNELTKRGHQFVLFHPKGHPPDWLEFKGSVRPFSALENEPFDVGLSSEYSILSRLETLQARAKFFYFVLEGHKKEKEVIKKGYFFLGNSEGICRRIERKYHVACLRASGGINPVLFHPLDRQNRSDEFKILCYGRAYKKRKGIHLVIRAVERVYKEYSCLKLIFFDSFVGEDRRDPRPLIRTRVPYDFYFNLPQDRMAWLFSQADVFVSAEKRAGWSNTAAEAMACRLPVVCTRSGTQDFAFHNQTALVVPFRHSCFLARSIKKLIDDEALRSRLARQGYNKIREFTWSALADRLEAIFREKLN